MAVLSFFLGYTHEGGEVQEDYVVPEEIANTCILGKWNLQTIHQFGTVHRQPQL